MRETQFRKVFQLDRHRLLHWPSLSGVVVAYVEGGVGEGSGEGGGGAGGRDRYAPRHVSSSTLHTYTYYVPYRASHFH